MKKTILFTVLFISLGAIFLLQSGISMAQSGENPLEGTSADEIMKNQANTTAKKSTATSPTTNTSSSSSLINPLGKDDIEDVLGNIMSYLRGIAGTIAVIFIIIGGVMYMISGGSKEMTERAKKTVIFAMVGLAIVLAAPLFYQEIKAVLSGDSPGSALQSLLGNILKLLLSIVGFLAIISMVVGSIWMFTAVGNDDKYELGKKTATYSIIGLVIAVASLVIATQVTNLIGNK
jgi:type IV secretory pathway VirB2 component (pilin)